MSRFDRFLGKGVTFDIENEEGEKEKIHFKPMNIDNLPLFMKVAQMLQGSATIKDDKGEDVLDLSKIDPEAFDLMKDLILEELKTSYPEEDEKVLKQLGMTHMTIFMEKILEANIAEPKKNLSKIKSVASFSEKPESAKTN